MLRMLLMLLMRLDTARKQVKTKAQLEPKDLEPKWLRTNGYIKKPFSVHDRPAACCRNEGGNHFHQFQFSQFNTINNQFNQLNQLHQSKQTMSNVERSSNNRTQHQQFASKHLIATRCAFSVVCMSLRCSSSCLQLFPVGALALRLRRHIFKTSSTIHTASHKEHATRAQMYHTHILLNRTINHVGYKLKQTCSVTNYQSVR